MPVAESIPTPGSGQPKILTGDASAESHEALTARLYRQHNEALIRFLRTRVGSEQEARDVAQEAYVRMLQLHSHGAVSFLSAYLFRTAANIAIDRARNRSVRARVERVLTRESELGRALAPEVIVEAREELELISRFVEELPPKCRQAFYLHRLHDWSPPRIAEELGITKRTVHNYLVRALVHVRLRLDAANSKEHSP